MLHNKYLLTEMGLSCRIKINLKAQGEEMKNAIILVVCLLIISVVTYGQDCECETSGATWLMPEAELVRIHYVVGTHSSVYADEIEAGVRLKILLDLPTASIIHFAKQTADFMGQHTRSRLERLLGPGENDTSYVSLGYNEIYKSEGFSIIRCPTTSYWFSVRSLPPLIARPDEIMPFLSYPISLDLFNELQEIFVRLPNGYWLQFNLPGGQVIPPEGYILAELRQEVTCENRKTFLGD
jgi:hypothetical protein